MMDYPLTVQTIYQRARTLFPDKPLVTRQAAGGGPGVRRDRASHGIFVCF